MKKRCPWPGSDPLYVDYHDREWGVPVHDDRLLFEHLVLDGAQAGLSWLTILKRREGYRRAFDNFEIAKVAAYTEADVERLMADPGIIRNRLKILAAIKNAKATLKVIEEFGSLDAYLWGFVGGRTVQNAWTSLAQLPATSEISDRMSKDLKKRGFGFVGSTICYAFMQASGLVNDHCVGCFRHRQLGGGGKQ